MPTGLSQGPPGDSPGVHSVAAQIMIKHKCLPLDNWKCRTLREQTYHLSLQVPSR